MPHAPPAPDPVPPPDPIPLEGGAEDNVQAGWIAQIRQVLCQPDALAEELPLSAQRQAQVLIRRTICGGVICSMARFEVFHRCRQRVVIATASGRDCLCYRHGVGVQRRSIKVTIWRAGLVHHVDARTSQR